MEQQHLEGRFKLLMDELSRVEGRLSEEIEKSEIRQLASTTEKISALKDLINSTTTARHETITTELSRMQRDNGVCSSRCASTVNGFETRLQLLERFKNAVADYAEKCPAKIQGLESDVRDLKAIPEKINKLETSEITAIKGTIDDLKIKKSDATELAVIKKEVEDLKTWKEGNWQRTIIYTGVAIVAAVQVLNWFWDFYKNLPPGAGGGI